LLTAKLDSFLDFGKQRGFIENIRIRIIFVSTEGTKLAPACADIGVIDVPLDIVRPHIAGMEPLRYRIRLGTERGQVGGA
jgi:hypothetical protein